LWQENEATKTLRHQGFIKEIPNSWEQSNFKQSIVNSRQEIWLILPVHDKNLEAVEEATLPPGDEIPGVSDTGGS
jgi:hypothetical protein